MGSRNDRAICSDEPRNLRSARLTGSYGDYHSMRNNCAFTNGCSSKHHIREKRKEKKIKDITAGNTINIGEKTMRSRRSRRAEGEDK